MHTLVSCKQQAHTHTHAHTLELHAHECTHTHIVTGKDSKVVEKRILLLGALLDEKKEEKERLQTLILCFPHPSPSQWGVASACP